MDLGVILSIPDSIKLACALLFFVIWHAAALYWGQKNQMKLFERHEKDDQDRHSQVTEQLQKVEQRLEEFMNRFIRVR